ncbi:MAG: flagellar export protein FliJ [Desulfitobacteriaceae bacterium]
MVFRFRLEASLRLAEKASEEAQRRLAEETRKWQLCLQARDQQQDRWHQALEGQGQAGMAHPETLGLWQAYAKEQNKKLQIREADLVNQERHKEERRSHVVEAHRELEKLKRLKAKQAQAFALSEQRKEQKVLDEVAQVTYWHQNY